MKVSYPSADDTPRSHLPFSPAVRAGDLLFVSGQASVDSTGAIIDDDFEAEMRRSIANLEKILADSGCTLADVVQTRNYVRDAADLPAFNALYREFFSPPYPARTTITNCLSGSLKFEIECVAVVPGG